MESVCVRRLRCSARRAILEKRARPPAMQGRERCERSLKHAFDWSGLPSAWRRCSAWLQSFVRTSGAFDGVIDFDRALQDPANPLQMLAAYDSGDHLHPNDAGYQAMANAVNLSLFRQ